MCIALAQLTHTHKHVQEGLDSNFADAMLMCIRKSIGIDHISELVAFAADSQTSHGHIGQQQQGLLHGQNMLGVFVEYVKRQRTAQLHRRHGCCGNDDAAALQRVKNVIRMGMLGCNIAQACMDRVNETLGEFSLCISLSARRYLLLSAIKMNDSRYFAIAIVCVCVFSHACVCGAHIMHAQCQRSRRNLKLIRTHMAGLRLLKPKAAA